MHPETRQRLRAWHAAIDPYTAIEPDDPRYVALPGRESVDPILSEIDLSIATTTQLVSGPRGAGKTTELLRLRRRLEEAGFTVKLVDMLEYVSRSAPLDVTEFLIALGIAVGEQFPPLPEERASFSTRLRRLLERLRLSIDLGPVATTVSAEGIAVSAFGLSADVDLKRELRDSQPLVEALRAKLTFHLGNLRAEVDDFFRELVAAHGRSNPESEGVVVIVDSVERLRGGVDNDAEVQASVSTLFVHHSDLLRFASHHTIYTVPPYIGFTDPGALPYDGSVRPVPIPATRTRQRVVDVTTVGHLVEVIERRIPWAELLPDRDSLVEIVLASGGHLRDLFRILAETILLVRANASVLPAEPRHVERAIETVARDFSQVTEEDVVLLRAIDEAGGDVHPSSIDVPRLARLVDAHMVLTHLDDRTWYEVHPLARRTLGLP